MRGIDANLVRLMEEDYNALHGGLCMAKDRLKRIPNARFGDYTIFQTAGRREYNIRKGGAPITECYLCTRMRSGILMRGKTFIVPDPVPFAAQHFLLRFVNNASNGEMRAPSARVQLTAASQEHRELLTADDIDSCVDLARETGFLVCQSMRGSGASVPNHIHAHAFEQGVPDALSLPWLDRAAVGLVRREAALTLSRSLTPAYGTLIEMERGSIGSRVARVFGTLRIPFNLVAGYGEPFHNHWVFVFWRTRESPLHPLFSDAVTGRWKFGFSEMLGLFEFKSEEQFLGLSQEILNRSLAETTVCDEALRERIETLLLEPPGSWTSGRGDRLNQHIPSSG